MAYTVVLNGVTYTLPSHGDNNPWDNVAGGLNAFFAAICTNTLQPTGGAFTLSAPIDFGGAFGLRGLYLQSETSPAASAGMLRMGHGDALNWRNGTNSADIGLAVGGSDQLTYAGQDVTKNAAAIYTTAAGQTFTTGSTAIVNFGTSEYDPQLAVTTGASWHYTAPSAGAYSVSSSLVIAGAISSGATLLQLFKNGSAVRTIWRSLAPVPTTTTMHGNTLISCALNDTLDIRFTQASGGSVSLSTVALENHVSISRLVT